MPKVASPTHRNAVVFRIIFTVRIAKEKEQELQDIYRRQLEAMEKAKQEKEANETQESLNVKEEMTEEEKMREELKKALEENLEETKKED